MTGNRVNPEQHAVIGQCLKAAYPVDTAACFGPLITALSALESPATAAPARPARKWFSWLS